MTKVKCCNTLCLGFFVLLTPLPALAQDLVVIRPGDKIEWVTNENHRLRIGGTPADVTPLGEAEKVISFSPDPNNANTINNVQKVWNTGTTVTGTVKAGADTQGVGHFVFTCDQHPNGMLSFPFRIEKADNAAPGAASRTLKISSQTGQKWVLQVDTTP